MKRLLSLNVIFLLCLGIFFVHNTFLQASPTNTSQQEINKLIITGNQNFTLTAQNELWSGDGSASSPFIISNITNNLPLDLFIFNTSLYFEIKNYDIHLSDELHISFQNVSNGKILGNSFIGKTNDVAIKLDRCSDFEIHDNQFIGETEEDLVNIQSSSNIIFSNNKVENQLTGISIGASKNITIENNSFKTLDGFNYTYSNGTIKDNDLGSSGMNIVCFNTPFYGYGTQFANNSVNSKQILVWINESNKIVPQHVGQIILINT
ncbi:MAG: right-handed parallel beta-helix repeat-containing protein, partial [Candidatus Thorarchaeota archaeon]